MKKKLLLLLLFVLTPVFVEAHTNSNMTITSIDCVVEGESVLLESDGEFLLMDTCVAGTSNEALTKIGAKNELISKLKSKLSEKNTNTLDIYISHYHSDHYGLLKKILDDPELKINKIYLPKEPFNFLENIAQGKNMNDIKEYVARTYDFESEEIGTTLNGFDSIIKYFYSPQDSSGVNLIPYAKSKGIEIVYLQAGNSFDVGSSHIDIIGPVANFKLRDTKDSDAGGRLGHFINNYSLVARIKSGNTVFLSAGDIEIEEEKALLKKGIDLKSNIFKLSHHAGLTSNDGNYNVALGKDTLKKALTDQEIEEIRNALPDDNYRAVCMGYDYANGEVDREKYKNKIDIEKYNNELTDEQVDELDLSCVTKIGEAKAETMTEKELDDALNDGKYYSKFLKTIDPQYTFYRDWGDHKWDSVAGEIYDFNHPNWTKTSVRRIDAFTNILSTAYNGDITYKVVNDKIDVFASRYYHTFKIHYIDYDTNKELDNVTLSFVKGRRYYLNSLNIKIPGYDFYKTDAEYSGRVEDDKDINVYYKKVKEEKPTVVDVPDTYFSVKIISIFGGLVLLIIAGLIVRKETAKKN